MAIEIKSRHNGRVLYAAENAKDVRAAVQEAVERGANLRGANLEGAYLRGANLEGANLEGANLRGAEGFKPELTDDLRIGIPGVPIDDLVEMYEAGLFGDAALIAAEAVRNRDTDRDNTGPTIEDGWTQETAPKLAPEESDASGVARTQGIHTCHADCPCQTGGEPVSELQRYNLTAAVRLENGISVEGPTSPVQHLFGQWVKAEEAAARIKEAEQTGAERVFAALAVHFAGHPDFDAVLARFDREGLTTEGSSDE